MNTLQIFSIFLCLVGILAPVHAQPTKNDQRVIKQLTSTLATQLEAGNYKAIYDLMGSGAKVIVDNKIFKKYSEASNRDDLAKILNAYKSFAPIKLVHIDDPVYLSSSDHFKVKIGAELGLKFNPYKGPIRIESVFTFKGKHPKLYQIQTAKLIIHLQGK